MKKIKKITVNRKDIVSILSYREGSDNYIEAERNLRQALDRDLSKEETHHDYVKIKWWALSHKRHYEENPHCIIVPSHFNDLEIQFTVKKEFDKIYNDVNFQSGFRWVKDE